MIFIGSDHAGFVLKQAIKENLDELGIKYQEVGNQKFNPRDDYTDFAEAVGRRVVASKGGKGILICSSGIGMAMAANKIKGVRAANVLNLAMAAKSRQHNNSNVLCLGQDYIGPILAKKIVRVWLGTKFSSAARHRRRLAKIERRRS